MSRRLSRIALAVAVAAAVQWASPLRAPAAFAQAAESSPTRRIGAIKAINGTTLTLTPDSGNEISVTAQPATRILRIAPGEKDLKSATPLTFQDLQVSDRIMAAGKVSDDGTSMAASVIVVMKRSDVDAQKQKTLDDWRKRGVDGPVKSLDAEHGLITVSLPGFGGAAKEILIRISKDTIIRRYPPGSANFADAKPGTLAEIHAGDQLRARGNRNADGSEVAAEEIVSGSFRNIAGMIDSVDAAAQTVTVHDLLSKKSVTVKVNSDSLLRKLSPEVVRLVMGMKGEGGGNPGAPSNAAAGGRPAPGFAPGGPGGGAGGGMSGATTGRVPDINRILGRMPAIALGDLQKGDVVMIVATEATPTSDAVVTKLLNGVEPIMRAAPSASQALMLTPWNLGGAPGGESGN